MKVRISKRFAKDVEKITDPRILAKIRTVLENAVCAQSIAELDNVEDMAGYPNYHRIKFDYRYRIGVYLNQDTLEFLRAGARGDFYKQFP